MSILHGVETCLVSRVLGNDGRSCRQRTYESSVSSVCRKSFFFYGTNSLLRFSETIVWTLCVVPGYGIQQGSRLDKGELAKYVGIEVLNVGGWLAHGDACCFGVW